MPSPINLCRRRQKERLIRPVQKGRQYVVPAALIAAGQTAVPPRPPPTPALPLKLVRRAAKETAEQKPALPVVKRHNAARLPPCQLATARMPPPVQQLTPSLVLPLALEAAWPPQFPLPLRPLVVLNK